MTRQALTPLLIISTLLGASGARAASAPDMNPPMPIQVAGSSLAAEDVLSFRPSPAVTSKSSTVAGVFQPAPMPDPDVDAPAGGGAHGPSITPALFSHKAEFAGDGFAASSDADHGLDHRRAPAAGLNWSVPVK